MSDAPFSIQPPPLPTAPDLSQYIGIASQQLNTGFSGVTDAITNAGTLKAQGLNAQADATDSTVSTLQKTASDLENEFKVEQDLETKQANQQNQAEEGSALSALGKSGIDP